MATDIAASDTRTLVEELRRRVSGEVRFDKMTRLLYSTDASIYQIEPIGVVIPKTEEDVIAVVETAGRHGVPVLPRGGGTSLAGQAVGHAVVIDFSTHMRGVLKDALNISPTLTPARTPSVEGNGWVSRSHPYASVGTKMRPSLSCQAPIPM